MSKDITMNKKALSDVLSSADGQTINVTTYDGSLLTSTDGGQNWKSQENVIPKSSRIKSFVDENKLYTAGDEGKVGFGGGRPTSTVYSLYDIAVSDDGQKLYVVGKGENLLFSDNGGQSWSAKVSGTKETLRSLFRSKDGQRLYAVGDKGVIVASNDGGQSWKVLTSGVTNDLNLISGDAEGRILYASGSAGLILLSDDYGQTWKQESNGFTEPLLTIASSPGGKTVCVGGTDGTLLCKYR